MTNSLPADLESRIRELLADYPSIKLDFVLAMCYTDGASPAFIIKHSQDKKACRRATRMLWIALLDDSARQPAPTEESEEDE